MNPDALRSWLDSYGRACENGDSKAATALFTEGVSYHESPHDEPMRGRLAVSAYWSHIPRRQSDVRFNYEVINLRGNDAVVHWTASFIRVPSNIKVLLDGIFILNFKDNLCNTLREWWMRQER